MKHTLSFLKLESFIFLCTVIVFAQGGDRLAVGSRNRRSCEYGRFSPPTGGCHPCAICYHMIDTGKDPHGCGDQCPPRHDSVADDASVSIPLQTVPHTEKTMQESPPSAKTTIQTYIQLQDVRMLGFFVGVCLVLIVILPINVVVLMICRRRKNREFTTKQYQQFDLARHDILSVGMTQTQAILNNDVIQVRPLQDVAFHTFLPRNHNEH